MRDRIAVLAAANGRSMNAELIDRIEKSLVDSDNLKNLEMEVAELWTKVAELDDRTVQLSNRPYK